LEFAPVLVNGKLTSLRAYSYFPQEADRRNPPLRLARHLFEDFLEIRKQAIDPL
jgi:hypothetical protein